MAADFETELPDGGVLRGAVARPSGGGAFPGIVVLHEAIGDRPEIRTACDRFADHGYIAAMPDLFSDGPNVICLARAIREIRSGRPGRVVDRIDKTRVWLAERADVDGERIGVIGFCMGGAFALAYVAGGPPGVRVASANYTEVPKEPARLRGACPIVASFGGKDRGFGRDHADRLSDHLRSLGIENDVKVYDNAGHSFMTEGHYPIGKLVLLPLHVGYVEDAAADAWRRVFAFFDSRLKTA